MSQQDLDRYSRYIAGRVKSWATIQPKAVLVCDSAPLLLAHGIKEAFQHLSLNSAPSFHRVDARSFTSPWSYKRARDSLAEVTRTLPTIETVEQITSRADAIRLSELTNQTDKDLGAKRAMHLRDKRQSTLLIFDQALRFQEPGAGDIYEKGDEFAGTRKPIKIFEHGTLTDKARKILAGLDMGRTSRAAFLYAKRLGFQEVWFDASSPMGYHPMTKFTNDPKVKDSDYISTSSKNRLGPSHVGTDESRSREQARKTLHDFKLAGVLAAHIVANRGVLDDQHRK